MRLRNKIALVTGGDRGIGKAIVLEFAKEGATVAFIYKENFQLANNLVKELKNKKRKAMALKADVSNFDKTVKVVNSIKNMFGRIDIVVNNAGIIRDKILVNMSRQDWDIVINTNLTGVFNITRAVIFDLIKQRKGSIINISSVAAFKPLRGQSSYVASKAGILGFTRAIALEVAGFGITVNAVAPGYIETDMLNDIPYNIKKDLLKFIPVGRIGKAEEVARLVSFLASEENKYITGQVITIDGGLSLL